MTWNRTLIIEPKIRGIIPPLTQDELDLLHASLLSEGCRDALVIWAGHNILLDGHHRYEFCRAHNIPFEVIKLELATLEEAVNWVINNQLGRRNLTPEAVSYLRGKRYQTEKKEPWRPQKGGQNDHLFGRTAETLAEELKVSARTIRRDAADGAFEALMRTKYMKKKTKTASDHIVLRSRGNGLVLEKIFVGWFRENWPTFYLPADNDRIYSRPCDHDFKIKIGEHIFKVDVSGPRQDGSYGNPGGGKQAVDLHLLCEIEGSTVCWKSVIPGNEYKATVVPLFGRSPLQMIVWLNCLREKIDYMHVRECALHVGERMKWS